MRERRYMHMTKQLVLCELGVVLQLKIPWMVSGVVPESSVVPYLSEEDTGPGGRNSSHTRGEGFCECDGQEHNSEKV